jgi:hypothetical protein
MKTPGSRLPPSASWSDHGMHAISIGAILASVLDAGVS